MRTRWVAVPLLLAGSAAAASSLTATYGNDVIETAHRVEVELDGRVARVREARRVENRGAEADEAVLWMELPDGAAAVGLRVRAGGGAWTTGRVLEAVAASDRYAALTTTGAPGGRRGPALLTWGAQGEVGLNSFPLWRGRAIDVEVDAVAAPCSWGGLAVLYLPPTERGDGDVAPVLGVRPGARRSWIVRAGGALPRALSARWSDLQERCPPERDRGDAVVWDVDAPGGPPVRAGLARMDLASGRRLVRLELDVARELAPLPRRARVVFVMDASVSQGADGVAAQLALAQGALAHVPDADVELVLYRRHASPLLGRFEPAPRLARRLAELPPAALALENGSELDQGLALAGALLRRAGGDRPARVIAFTDDLLRETLGAPAIARALRGLPAHAVVHLVSTGGNAAADRFARDDEHAFAAAIAGTGGMAVIMNADAAAADPATAASAMHGLLQPLTIDAVSIEAGPDGPDLDVGEQLPAGEAVRAAAWTARAAEAPVRLRGRVWGRAIDRVVTVAPELEAALPALVVADGTLWGELEPDEQLEVARRAHAVSPVTSLLADPGAPPTRVADAAYGSGCCTISLGHVGSVLRCGIGRTVTVGVTSVAPRVDPAAALARLLRPSLDGCVALHGGALRSLDVEVTYAEVVAVAADATNPPLSTCATEAAWDLALDRATFRIDRETYRVAR